MRALEDRSNIYKKKKNHTRIFLNPPLLYPRCCTSVCYNLMMLVEKNVHEHERSMTLLFVWATFKDIWTVLTRPIDSSMSQEFVEYLCSGSKKRVRWRMAMTNQLIHAFFVLFRLHTIRFLLLITVIFFFPLVYTPRFTLPAVSLLLNLVDQLQYIEVQFNRFCSTVSWQQCICQHPFAWLSSPPNSQLWEAE